jgi:hypothetical protein
VGSGSLDPWVPKLFTLVGGCGRVLDSSGVCPLDNNIPKHQTLPGTLAIGDSKGGFPLDLLLVCGRVLRFLRLQVAPAPWIFGSLSSSPCKRWF